MIAADVLLYLAAIAACVTMQGLFSGSEYALFGADRLVLRSRAEGGDAGARRVLALVANEAPVVGTCLIGANLASVAGSTLVTGLLLGLARGAGAEGQLAELLSFVERNPEILVVLTYAPLTVVFSEMIPKSVGQQYAHQLAPYAATFVGLGARLFAPAIALLGVATRSFMNAIGMGDAKVNTVRRDDIRLLIDNAESGDIRAEEKEMILRVFSFSDTTAGDVMVPLIEVQAVAETVSCDEAAALMAEVGHSRVPVFRKRVDRIVGVVSHHEVAFSADQPISAVMRPVMFVPETTTVDALFLDMRRRRARMAIVVNEYGGAVGLISIEDILEEIVGEIDDEFSRRAPLIRRIAESEWLASARVERGPLRTHTGFELPDGEFDTLAGFLLAQFGHVPSPGQRLTWGSYAFTVAKGNERAILEVTIHATGRRPGA